MDEYTDSFPECLYIPKFFVDYCYNLYTAGEKQKKELGVTISWDKKGELKIGDKVTEGTQTGITLPNVDDDSYFGDLHCHPSSSIGHKNGYAAHSPEDLYSMRYNKNKPLFLRFVCSNKKIYLMAYRNNYSEIVEKTIFDMGQRNSDIAADYFNTNCPLNKAERNELMLKYEGPEFNEQMNSLHRNTPGLPDHTKVDPDHDPLLGEPRFKAMLAAAEAQLSVDGPRSPQGSNSPVGKPIAPEKGRCAAVVAHEGRGPAIVDKAVALDPQGVVRR
jgi:hypothetical protein